MTLQLIKYSRLLTAIILLVIIHGNAHAQADNSDNDDNDPYINLVGEADEAIAKEDWATADRLLTQAIKLRPGNPTNAMLLSNLGIIRFYAGRDSLALATLNDAVELFPSSTRLLANRAQVLSALRYEKEAFADYTKIIELDSTLVEPRFYHAMIAMRAADMATAEADLKALERQHADHRLTHIGLATFYSSTNQHQKAIPYFTKVLEKEKEPEYYGARALCYILTDQLNEASTDIAEALKIDPSLPEIYLYRALLNQRRFRPDDAKRDAKRAIELGANKRQVKSLIGDL